MVNHDLIFRGKIIYNKETRQKAAACIMRERAAPPFRGLPRARDLPPIPRPDALFCAQGAAAIAFCPDLRYNDKKL